MFICINKINVSVPWIMTDALKSNKLVIPKFTTSNTLASELIIDDVDFGDFVSFKFPEGSKNYKLQDINKSSFNKEINQKPISSNSDWLFNNKLSKLTYLTSLPKNILPNFSKNFFPKHLKLNKDLLDHIQTVYITSQIPPLYIQIEKACLDFFGNIDYSKIRNLFLSSNITPNDLDCILNLMQEDKEIKSPQTKLYIILSLISLAQDCYPIKSFEILKNISKPPLPKLDLNLLYSNDDFTEFQSALEISHNCDEILLAQSNRLIESIPTHCDKNKLEDKYAALRLLSEEPNAETLKFSYSNMSSKSYECLQNWVQCILHCTYILEEIINILHNENIEVRNKILTSDDGLKYLSCLQELYYFTNRIRFSYQNKYLNDNTELKELLFKNKIKWLEVRKFFPDPNMIDIVKEHLTPHIQKDFSLQDEKQLCKICQLDICLYPSPIAFNNSYYHAPCANFWLNCLNSVLPSLEFDLS